MHLIDLQRVFRDMQAYTGYSAPLTAPFRAHGFLKEQCVRTKVE